METAHSFIDILRLKSPSNKQWEKFRNWMTSSKLGRSAGQRLTHWSQLTNPDKGEVQYGFGFERFEEYATSTSRNSSTEYLDVVNEAIACKVFDRSKFVNLPAVPRLALFCKDTVSDGFEIDNQPCFQRTIVIVETRPMHMVSEDSLKTRWVRENVWNELFDSYDGGTKAKDINYATFHLTRTLLSAVMDERIDDWAAHFQEVGRHLGTLERQVHESSSDDSHSTDLWSLSKHLIDARALVSQHAGTMEWAQVILEKSALMQMEQTTANTEDQERWEKEYREPWLHKQHNELITLAENVENESLKIVDHMIDLMYKSISIRDTRLSLELNASLRRLSWITFIFLPLTFLVGFFGMNVNTFVNGTPSLKWYFIAAVPLMVFILVSWLTSKNLISDSHGARQRSRDKLKNR